MMNDFKYVTQPIPRIEGKSLALGAPVYMADLLHENQNYAVVKAIHCPYPFAEVESYDTTASSKIPGFLRLITWEDTPIMTNFGWPYTPYERHILNPVGRYEGDVVALIVAQTEEAAERARSLIKIKWKKRKPLMNAMNAMNSDVIVHGDHMQELVTHVDPNSMDPDHDFSAEKNRVFCWEKEWGNVEDTLTTCAYTAHANVHTSPQIHCQFETHRCYTYLDERDRLTVVAPTQAADAVQEDVARCLGLDRRSVRVIKTQVGGGFGGKNIFSPYVYCALVTLLLREPAVLIFSREEAMISIGTRHEYDLECTMGCDEEGYLKVIDAGGVQNAGAYSEISLDVLETGIHNSYSMFPRVDAMRICQYSVFTNRVEGCAFRGFGATQNCFLLNAVMRHLSDVSGISLPELFLKNIGQVGDSHPVMNGYLSDDPAQIFSTSLSECIRRAMDRIGWEDHRNHGLPPGEIVHGVGIGIASHASGVPRVDRGNVIIAMNSDGSFCVYTGHSDIGTGSNTVMLQIVAEVLNVPVEHIHIVAADTSCTPFDPGTYASSNTYRCGGAAKRAAEKMKELLWNSVRKTYEIPEEEQLIFRDEIFYREDRTRLADLIEFADARSSYWQGGDPLVVSASFPDDFAPSPYVATCAEVEVDRATGMYRVLRMSSAIDCGRVMNPINARVQAMGGIAQSIGMTMFEEVKYGASGENLSRDFESYKIPCQMDMPQMDIEFVETEEPTGPFGAKSLGEIATGSPAPAITDALFNALGIHFDSLPVTPEVVLRAIKEKEKAGEP